MQSMEWQRMKTMSCCAECSIGPTLWKQEDQRDRHWRPGRAAALLLQGKAHGAPCKVLHDKAAIVGRL